MRFVNDKVANKLSPNVTATQYTLLRLYLHTTIFVPIPSNATEVSELSNPAG